jgi:hypothetical protein
MTLISALNYFQAEALETARLFMTKNIESKDKAIILISDLDYDRDQWGGAIKEITRISLANINMYVIATGQGKERAGNLPQLSNLKIFDSKDQEGIEYIYEELSVMQISPIREEEGFLKESLIPLLVFTSLGTIFISLVLSETRFRKIP